MAEATRHEMNFADAQEQLAKTKSELVNRAENHNIDFPLVRQFVDAQYDYNKAWYKANTPEAIQAQILNGHTASPQTFEVAHDQSASYKLEMEKWQRTSEGLAQGNPREALVRLNFEEVKQRELARSFESMSKLVDTENVETKNDFTVLQKRARIEANAYDKAREQIANEFKLPHIKLPDTFFP